MQANQPPGSEAPAAAAAEACVIVCKTSDGRILVNAAGGDAAQQYLQDAIEVPSVEEAAAMVSSVLGEGGEEAGEQGKPAATDKAPAAPAGAEGMPMGTEEEQMEAGYKRARKGY